MGTVVVRYRTTEEGGDPNQALVENVFKELVSSQPKGLRYATFRLADGVTFIHIAMVETADGSNPLNDSSAFAEFQRELMDRCEQPPSPLPATIVGSYGFFD